MFISNTSRFTSSYILTFLEQNMSLFYKYSGDNIFVCTILDNWSLISVADGWLHH